MKKIIASLGIGATLFIAGCGNGTDGEQEAAAGNGSDEVIKIGSLFELTGSAAEYGQSMNEAVHMAVEEINAAGGIDGVHIEVVERDIASDESQAAQGAMAMTSDEGISAIIGPALTGTLQAAIPSANQNQVAIISPSATDDGVLQDTNGEVHPYAYRTSFTNSFQGGALALFSNEELQASKAVIFSDNSSDYAQGLTETFQQAFEGDVVSIENFTADQTDFSATLTNIATMDFDVLYVPGYYEQAGPIVKQAREMGIDQPIIGPDGLGNQRFYELAGMENMNDVYYTSHFAVESEDPEIQSFVETYEEATGNQPDMFTGLAYDAVYIVKEAIERAGSTDSFKVNEEIEATENFAGVTGTFSFDDNHDPVKTVSIIEVQNGEPSAIHEVDPNK
ncbi:ABC transporter substrate-binding protein [Alkalibacterium iburiense]|uniref:ABC transporter substrate-binding protein n=1 Tax=Alkalibacterium iburiense TaxID=290589 RepID=A0ABN0X2R6_9LACT